MAKFSLGEIAIVINTNQCSGCSNNHECEITSSRRYDYEQWGYDIMVPGFPSQYKDGKWFCPEFNLRKKQPPKEELGSWEDIQKITEWGDNAGRNPVKIPEHVK